MKLKIKKKFDRVVETEEEAMGLAELYAMAGNPVSITPVDEGYRLTVYGWEAP